MKNFRTVILAFATAMFLATGAGRVLAIDHSIFELDGDATKNQPTLPNADEWDILFKGEPNHADVFAFVADPDPKSIFAGGGSKDIYDIPSWKWKNGAVPDKDNITNAYAAGYIAAADNPAENIVKGDLLVYFGCDRFAINGDAFLGFWFFQNPITLVGTTSGFFKGQHAQGDILVLVNFPQGTNTGPTIQVVRWNTNSPSNLELLASGAVLPGSAVVCSSNDEACATTNLTPQPSPWPYTPKSGTAGTFPAEAFFEGGINLTQLLGSTPCFSSFVCESRSSEQFTATLKDFVLGQFPLCGIEVAKACQVSRLTAPPDGTTKNFVVTVTGEVTNTGLTWPADAVLTVKDTPTDGIGFVPANPQQIILPDPVPKGGTVPFSWQFFSDQNPPNNKVDASIAFGGANITAEPFNINCVKLPLVPGLNLDKSCETKLVLVGDVLAVQVHVKYTITNSGQVPLTVTATDPVLSSTPGNVLNGVLILAGAADVIVEKDYFPKQTSPPDEDNPGAANFSDTVSAFGTTTVPGVTPNPVEATPATANCKLCDCQ